jgi:peptidoglycan-associated lipoprotein
MRKLFLLVLLISGLMLTGCPSKQVVHPEQAESLQPASVAPAPKGPEQKISPVAKPPEEKITDRNLAKIETHQEPSKYNEEGDLFKDIYFDFDQYDIRPDAQTVLQEISTYLLKNTPVKILIEGHCDDRGTNEYNLALGDRRARAVRDYLVALGISSGRIETLSYGEEKPVCMEQTEDCWAKNRRAHFIVLREKGKQ